MSTLKMVKVLVVEDDSMVVKIIDEFLNKIGGVDVVGQAANIKDAKDMLLKLDMDLVLLDVYLPDGFGTDLLKWIRQKELDVDVIMITAEQSLEMVKQTIRYGVKDFIVKPFKLERLESAFQNYRERMSRLDKTEKVGQNEIDKIFRLELDGSNAGMNLTHERILKFLKKEYPKSFNSSEVAKALGISRITARRYLDTMEISGVILMELSYGNVGRPKNNYKYNID